MSEDAGYAFGPFLLDPVERTLTREGRPVRLTPKDLGVLLALVERHGALVDRDRLFAQVWPGVIVEDCNLARHVATIRQALGDLADDPAYIETLPKRGYRFLAPVSRVAAPDRGDAPPALPASPEPPGAAAPASPRPGLLRRIAGAPALRRSLAAGGVLASLSLAGWFATGSHALLPGSIRSLAVLPVANLTGDPHQDHVGEAVAAMLVADLGRRPEIQVVSRGTSSHYDRTALSARDVGRELGVDGLLEAAVVRADGQVRITAELVDARTDRLVWAEVFQAEAADLMELEDLIAEAVLEALQLGPAAGLTPEALRTAHPSAAGPACEGAAPPGAP